VNPQVETYPVAGTLDDVLGFELIEAAPERCRARFAAEPRVQQPMGLVHGGAYAALAESMVSVTTQVAVGEIGSFAVGQSNHTTFMRPITSGHVNAEGRALHRGRTTWVWDVTFTDDDGRVCAATRITVAVRSAER
jgi:1,4-dihydroxy-2-naphthoyl-CoA hydrolase